MFSAIRQCHNLRHGGDFYFANRAGCFQLFADVPGRIEQFEADVMVVSPALQKYEHAYDTATERVHFCEVQYQHTGIAAKFYVEHFDVAARHPRIHGGEMGWILESNEAMNRGMEMMGGRVVKRYRMYERVFS